PAAIDCAHRTALPRIDGAHELLERRLHPHYRGATPPLVGGDLAADGGERRRLSGQILWLVLGAGRSLLRRGGDPPGRDGRAPWTAGHAGRVGRGGELFLSSLGLSAEAPRTLCETPRLRLAEGADERSRELRAARSARPVDLAHHLRLGDS